MTQRPHHQDPHADLHPHQHGHPDGHLDEAGLAELLDLDAEVLGSYLTDVTDWVGQHASGDPRTVVDVGAGTGTGSLALARRFGSAEVVAIDRSASMLEHVRAAAREQGLADRLNITQADLDVAWPDLGAVDVVWAASSIHELADPDRVFRDVHGALNRGGLLVVIEMDAPPRFLPDDIGLGRPGLEARCHAALAQMGWNAHPDWRPSLERAGFEIAAQRSFTTTATGAGSPHTARYAHTYLSRIRPALDGQLAGDDLNALDHLLADDRAGAVLRSTGLMVRGSRTAWLARRP